MMTYPADAKAAIAHGKQPELDQKSRTRRRKPAGFLVLPGPFSVHAWPLLVPSEAFVDPGGRRSAFVVPVRRGIYLRWLRRRPYVARFLPARRHGALDNSIAKPVGPR
jgi:hypothetical protein